MKARLLLWVMVAMLASGCSALMKLLPRVPGDAPRGAMVTRR